MLRLAPLLVVCSAIAIALASQAAPEASGTVPGIGNIAAFLEQCPTNDPAYAQMRSDFELRREGVVVGAISCTEPVSAMPIAQYTDELIAVQTLRAIYYMEGGRSVPYPWTSGSLYDWMKSETGGIDLRLNGSYCCTNFNNQWYPVLATQGTWDRDYDRYWQGIAGQITVLTHEVRHIDGYPHVGFCPLFPDQPFGCDPEYNESDLTPYGLEWWLHAKWLSGEINVGFGCASASEIAETASYHMDTANLNYRLRFVTLPPPLLSMPAQPGGPCPGGSSTSTPVSTASPSPSPTQTPAPTATPGPSPTPTASPSPAPTPSPVPTATPSPTPTALPSPTATATPSPAAPDAPTATPSPAPSATPRPTEPVATATSAPTSTASPTATPTPTPSGQRSNVNCDGVTDQRDLLVMLEAAGGLPFEPGSSCPMPGTFGAGYVAGDANCDGRFDIDDVLALLRTLAGLPGSC